MRAARIHAFGPPGAIVIDEISRPAPSEGEVIVRVKAAGVAPWDAWIREGKSVVKVTPPVILGSDLCGVVEETGPRVSEFAKGDEVYGVTNPQFCGAYAEYAVASAGMIAHKPKRLSDVEAASAPVVAVTAWQMLFEYGDAKAGQTALIHGAAGNVGAYAVQLASRAGLRVIATVAAKDAEYAQRLGADQVLDYATTRFDERVSEVDLVLDMVGGETRERSIAVLKAGGTLVTVVSPMPPSERVRTVFFLAEVSTRRLNTLTELFDSGKLEAQVGSVLPLEEVRTAHEMLSGAPHKRGKIVLRLD